MKKIFTLALAMLLTVSGFAAPVTRQSQNVATAHANAKTVGDANVKTPIQKMYENVNGVKKSAGLKTAVNYDNLTWTSLGEGIYKDNIISAMYNIAAVADPVKCEIEEAQGNPGIFRLVNPYTEQYPATLIVDASDPDCVVIPYQQIPIKDSEDGITFIASISWIAFNEFGLSVEDFLDEMGDVNITYDKANSTINLGTEPVWFQWPEAPADSSYGTEPDEWYSGSDVEGYIILPGGTWVDPWEDLGEGEFSESILTPSFTDDARSNGTVEIKKSTEREGMYQVINPWTALYAALGFNAVSPTLTLDASDPDNILIDLTSTGISGGSDGLYSVISYSAYMDINGQQTPDEYKITLTEKEITQGGKTYIERTFTLPHRSVLLYAAGTQSIYYTGTADDTDPSTIVVRTELAAPSPEYVFNFNVTDNNNKPVANASINFTLNNNNINVTNTDANGKATVSVTGDFSGATYSYTVSGSIDGTVVSTEGQGTVGATTTDINVTLTPAPKREIALVFNVTDDNEKAIAGAKIEVMEGTTIIATLTTGADGSAKSEVIDDIDGKKLTYTVTAEGYEDEAGSFTVVGYDTTTTPWIYTCDVVMTPVVVETFVVRFNVSDKDKNPVKDASIVITLEDNTIAELRTDAQGVAETEPLEELGGATLDFTVTAANYAEYNGTLVVEGYEGELPYIIEYNVTLNSSKINTVGIDSNNESVRYFNLQGLEISKPEKGQIVIRVANGNVEKTVVK